MFVCVVAGKTVYGIFTVAEATRESLFFCLENSFVEQLVSGLIVTLCFVSEAI